MADEYFSTLTNYANQLVAQAQGMTQENPPQEGPSIAVGEPSPAGESASPEVAAPDRASESEAAPPSWSQPRRYFQSLADDADALVSQARQPPPSQVVSEVGGSTPIVYWQPRRYFQDLGAETQKPAAPTPAAQSASPPLMPVARRQTWGRAPVSPPASQSPAAASSQAAPRTIIYAVGGYFVPEEPSLPMTDYFRSWDQLTREQADAKVRELAALGVPPYYFNGREWVLAVRSV